MNKEEKDYLKKWMKSLSDAQKDHVMEECIEYMIVSEMISYDPCRNEFWELHSGPYWYHTGEGIESK